MTESRYILVTGSTGFVGAHVIDALLRLGHRVRVTARSAAKGELIRQARPETADRIDLIVVGDLSSPAAFDLAVKGVDGIIHCAAPVALHFNDNEKDVILPTIEGTKSIISAAAKEPSVKRIVITSSFATVINCPRGWGPGWTYTNEDWNPITYDEVKNGPGIMGYRGGKKFSELYAWDYIRDQKPHFDLVTLVPPMVYGPIVHSVSKISELNESSKFIWRIVDGQEYPAQAIPAWVDVRDLAIAHAEAIMRPEVGNRRFIVAAPEKFSFQQVADIIREEFDWAKDVVRKGNEGEPLPESFDVDGATAGEAFGIKYRTFRESIVDAVKQLKEIQRRETE